MRYKARTGSLQLNFFTEGAVKNIFNAEESYFYSKISNENALSEIDVKCLSLKRIHKWKIVVSC